MKVSRLAVVVFVMSGVFLLQEQVFTRVKAEPSSRKSTKNEETRRKVKHRPLGHVQGKLAHKSHMSKRGQVCSAVGALDGMDTRVPVPLMPMMGWHQKQNMRAHLLAIQQIVGSLAIGNWKGLSRAARTIESSPQMQRMCRHMGAGAKGFARLALEFHQRADEIARAAKKQDVKAVLKAVSHTLKACNTCHATYKQEIVDIQTWQQRSGSHHKPGHPMPRH